MSPRRLALTVLCLITFQDRGGTTSAPSGPVAHRVLWESPSTRIFAISLAALQKTDAFQHQGPTLLIPLSGLANLQQRDAALLPNGPSGNLIWYREGGKRVMSAPVRHVLYNIDSRAFVGIEIESLNARFQLLPRFTAAADQVWKDGALVIGKHNLKPHAALVLPTGCSGVVVAFSPAFLRYVGDERTLRIAPGEAVPFQRDARMANASNVEARLLSICDKDRQGAFVVASQER